MSCIMPDGAFRTGCDVITSELRQAWSAIDRAGKAVETKLAIYRDDTCHVHEGPTRSLREDITTLRRRLEQIEVEARLMASPVKPSRV